MPPTSTFEIRGKDGRPVGLVDVEVLEKWSGQTLRPWNNTVVIEVPNVHPTERNRSPIQSLKALCRILGLEEQMVPRIT